MIEKMVFEEAEKTSRFFPANFVFQAAKAPL